MIPQDRPEPTIDFTSAVFDEPPALPPPVPKDYAHPRTAAARGKSSYIGAHWRGELPLAQSYWINVFLIGFLLLIVETMMIPLLRAQHLSLTSLLVLLAIYTPLRLVVTVWQVVGTFRSAALSGSGWAVVVNIVMIFVVLGTIGSGITTVKSFQMIARAAVEQRSMSDFTVGLAPNGKGILAKGTMGIGFADAVQAAFAKYPEQRHLLLDSRGGDVDNGMQLHDYLAAHSDIVVEVDHLCASACTLAFVGASQRLVGPNAEMGFHQMRSIIDSNYSKTMVNTQQDSFKGFMSKLGASQSFIDMAFAKQGGDVWVPDGNTLFANHIITGVAIDDRVIGEHDWHGEQFLYAYRKEPTMRNIGVAFEHLRSQQPDIYNAWAERNMAILRQATRAQRIESYRANLWQTLRGGRAVAMARAPDAAVRSFAVRYRDQLEMIRDKESLLTCDHYLDGTGVELKHVNTDFYIGTGTAYDALFSAPLGTKISDHERSEGTQLMMAQRQAILAGQHVTGSPVAGQLCQRQIALLGRLIDTPTPQAAWALRSYFIR
ncbi:hypothetical protein [Dyella sp. GSA-30]|uniref:hypothetical protein n=1 Tax=Dyella sp. GSA-30 TaxID=2994496 RepID=UPI0024927F06|nr:hypothetical protein [Dyella sp. GSA-30]BDU19691.1 hypothetical protein DYGSA30_11480 [Dyella sp. GSA-30]